MFCRRRGSRGRRSWLLRWRGHAFELDGSDAYGGAGEAADHGDCCQDEVSGFGVVDFLFDEHADAGCCDEAEEEDADAAHDGGGDGVDDGCYFSDKGEDDGEDGCASDDPRCCRRRSWP